MERAIVDSLLKKLGIETPEGLTPERAQEKLTKRLEKNGPPTGMTTDEADAVRELGIPTGSAPSENEEKPQDEASEAGASPAAGEAPDAFKENAVKKSKTKGGKPKKKEASAKKTAKQPAKASSRPAKASKAGTPTKGITSGPSPAKKVVGARANSGIEIFRKMFADENGKAIDAKKVLNDLQKAGVKDTTAVSYVTWAQRPVSKSHRFGFRLRKDTGAKGNVTLKRI